MVRRKTQVIRHKNRRRDAPNFHKPQFIQSIKKVKRDDGSPPEHLKEFRKHGKDVEVWKGHRSRPRNSEWDGRK